MSVSAKPNIAHKDDWHRAEILCELRKAGWSLRKLSASRGYKPGTLKTALAMPWPKGERIIADAIGVAPENIWPSRYTDPSRRGERN